MSMYVKEPDGHRFRSQRLRESIERLEQRLDELKNTAASPLAVDLQQLIRHFLSYDLEPIANDVQNLEASHDYMCAASHAQGIVDKFAVALAPAIPHISAATTGPGLDQRVKYLFDMAEKMAIESERRYGVRRGLVRSMDEPPAAPPPGDAYIAVLEKAVEAAAARIPTRSDGSLIHLSNCPVEKIGPEERGCLCGVTDLQAAQEAMRSRRGDDPR